MGNEESQVGGAKEGEEATAAEAPSHDDYSDLAKERSKEGKEKEKDVDLSKLTKEQREKIEEERLVEMQKEFPDAHRGDLLRFLRARQLSTKDGAAMFRKWLKWKEEFKPDECADDLFRKNLAMNRYYLIRMDQTSVPILYLVPRFHDPDVSPWKDVVRFAVYVAEVVINALPQPNSADFIMLVNCRGIGMKNVDMKLMSVGIDYYQDFFPERLHACYVFGLPHAMIGFWGVLQKLMDERTRQKIQLLKRSDVAQIFPMIPKEIVPEELYGDLKELSHDNMIALHEAFQKKRNGGVEKKVEGEKKEEKKEEKEEKKDS